MARVLTTLAGLVAVVAGIGGGIEWLNDQVSETTVFWTGWGLLALLCLAWLLGALTRRSRRWLTYSTATFVAAGVLVKVAQERESRESPLDELGYAFAAIALIPVAIELYLRDKALYDRCDDCDEEIRAAANVCKHCGYRIRPKPETAP